MDTRQVFRSADKNKHPRESNGTSSDWGLQVTGGGYFGNNIHEAGKPPRGRSARPISTLHPDPGIYPEYRGRNRGNDTDRVAAGAVSCKGRSSRSRATVHPKEDWHEQVRVFTNGFPRLVKEFIPTHLPTVVVPTARGFHLYFVFRPPRRIYATYNFLTCICGLIPSYDYTVQYLNNAILKN